MCYHRIDRWYICTDSYYRRWANVILDSPLEAVWYMIIPSGFIKPGDAILPVSFKLAITSSITIVSKSPWYNTGTNEQHSGKPSAQRCTLNRENFLIKLELSEWKM